MTGTAADRHRYDWLELHVHALTVGCPRCCRPVDQACVNALTGEVLAAPAHPQRISRADEVLAAEFDNQPKGHHR
jgi:hypothetical protein